MNAETLPARATASTSGPLQLQIMVGSVERERNQRGQPMAKSLSEVRTQLGSGCFEFSRHAFRRMVERNIGCEEISEAGQTAEIIEEYPDDKYSPSALLLGFTNSGRPLHLQVSLMEGSFTKLITVYEPDLEIWVNFRKRRLPDV